MRAAPWQHTQCWLPRRRAGCSRERTALAGSFCGVSQTGTQRCWTTSGTRGALNAGKHFKLPLTVRNGRAFNSIQLPASTALGVLRCWWCVERSMQLYSQRCALSLTAAPMSVIMSTAYVRRGFRASIRAWPESPWARLCDSYFVGGHSFVDSRL